MGSFRVRDRASHQVPFARLGSGASTAPACISTPIWSRPRYASSAGWTRLGSPLMQAAMRQLYLSARTYHRVLKLARTIDRPGWRACHQPGAPGRSVSVPAETRGVYHTAHILSWHGVRFRTRGGPVIVLVKWLRLRFQYPGRYLLMCRQLPAPPSWPAPIPMPHRRLPHPIEHVRRRCCAHSRPDRPGP